MHNLHEYSNQVGEVSKTVNSLSRSISDNQISLKNVNDNKETKETFISRYENIGL